MSIGLFDSGIGGLTVMRELLFFFPHTSIHYLGDTKRLPYGDKSARAVIQYSLENAHFLLSKGIKLLLVACNTASAYALEILQDELPIPVVGVVAPGAKAAMKASQSKRIGVIGTTGTIRSAAYQKAIEDVGDADLFSVACPLFVPLVEEHFLRHPATKQVAMEYLGPLKKESVDTLLLGCTHYPLLKELIEEVMGPQVTVVDSAKACAEEVAQLCSEMCLPHGTDRCYYTTDQVDRFKDLSCYFLGFSPENIEEISLSFSV